MLAALSSAAVSFKFIFFKKQILAGGESALVNVANYGWQKEAFERPLPGGFRVAKRML